MGEKFKGVRDEQVIRRQRGVESGDVAGHIANLNRQMRMTSMLRMIEQEGLSLMKAGASGDEVMDMVRDYVAVMDRVLGRDWGQQKE